MVARRTVTHVTPPAKSKAERRQAMFDSLFAMTALPNLHPALVHFPIALSAVALLFEAVV